MVEKVTVTVTSEMTRLGEILFTVKSHNGLYRSKCLHDALSMADVKMTGIHDITDSFWRKMATVEHFSIESKHLRFDERVKNKRSEEV